MSRSDDIPEPAATAASPCAASPAATPAAYPAAPPAAPPRCDLAAAPPTAPTRHAPTVWLVGAGPGDPELLTLKALRVIRAASVLLVDDLVGEAVLQEALRGVEPAPRIVPVGKRGGCRSTPQAFIHQLMIREARAGERVVRLKGGDPGIFGRGGEEADALRAAGLQVEVVHGITAGLAAAGALGASWTDRRAAQGVMLVTGHAQPGGAAPDWASIGAAARSGLTLVIYMGVTQAASIRDGLLPWLGADMPAAVVERASLPGERAVRTTLGALLQTIASEGLASPAVLWIGRVLEHAALAPRVAGALPLHPPADALRISA